jgi:hypothetical protein
MKISSERIHHYFRGLLIAATVAVGLGACGGSQSPPPVASGAGGMCPMQVQGTQVAAEDTQDGVALLFTTSGDVAELRKRVHHLAEKHQMRMSNRNLNTAAGAMGPHGPMGPGGMGPHGQMGPGASGAGHAMGHEHAMGHGHAMGDEPDGMHMVPSTARVEDIDRGARIVLTPVDAGKLAELRAHTRERAAHMAAGHCPMQHGHG